MKRVVPFLFFLSGTSGLIFETAWTRLYRDLFGGTLETTSAVLGSFMAGLALGAVLGGIAADRVARPLRLYGLLEAGIALAVLSSPAQLRLADQLLGTSGGPGWRWAVAFLLLMLPTTGMGATLPLLTRALVREGVQADRAVARLYGWNMLGAVLGVWGAGYVLIRIVGVAATVRAGSGLGLLAAALALLAASRFETEGPAAPEGTAPEVQPFPLASLVVLFVTGFTALAYEVLWTRLFSFVLGSSILSFSLVVGVFLASMACGSLVAPLLLPPRRKGLDVLGSLQLALGAASGLSLLPLFRPEPFRALGGGGVGSFLQSPPGRTLFVALVVALPGALMGGVLPSAVAAFASRARAGRDVGRLYAASGIGNVAGALAAGYLLVPRLGAAASIAALGATNLGLGAILLASRRKGGAFARALAWGVLPAAVLAACWLGVGREEARRRFFGQVAPHASLSSVREGGRGTVTLLDVPPLPVLADDAGPLSLSAVGFGYRLIAADGTTVAGTAADLRTTQRMQAHVPLLLHGRAWSVLQIGYGSGETAREVGHHAPARFDLVEINPALVEEADRWFRWPGVHAFRPVFADAKSFVRTTRERYDVILNDSTYPGLSGSSPLYSADHFLACRSRLAPGGIVSTWVPVDLPPETFRTILTSFRTAFPNASFWLAANCLNKHGVLVGSLDPEEERLAEFRARRWPTEVAASLGEIGYPNPVVLETARVLGSAAIARISAGANVNSDDRPRLEYPSRGHRVAGEEFWAETLDLILQESVRGNPGSEAQHRVLEAERNLLSAKPDEALRLLGKAAVTFPDHPGPEGLRQGIQVNRAQARWGEAMEALQSGDRVGAEQLLGETVSLAPGAAAPRYELGRLLFESGRASAALLHLRIAVARAAKPRNARLLLGDASLLSGNPVEAEEQYRAYLATEPPQFEVLAALGDSLLQQRRPLEAAAVLQQAENLRPGNEILGEMLSRARAESGRAR